MHLYLQEIKRGFNFKYSQTTSKSHLYTQEESDFVLEEEDNNIFRK